VNFGIDVLFGDILTVSLSLIKSWGSSSWEGDFRSVWNELFLTSWPWESLDVLVSEVLDILVNSFLADISVVSLIKFIELWVLASVWYECGFTSQPVLSLDVVVNEILNIFVHALLIDTMVSVLSLFIKLNKCNATSIGWVSSLRSCLVRMSSFIISKFPYVIVHFILTDILVLSLDEMEFVALHGDVLTEVLVSVHTGGEALVD
jgi:hypothetical protein